MLRVRNEKIKAYKALHAPHRPLTQEELQEDVRKKLRRLGCGLKLSKKSSRSFVEKVLTGEDVPT